MSETRMSIERSQADGRYAIAMWGKNWETQVFGTPDELRGMLAALSSELEDVVKRDAEMAERSRQVRESYAATATEPRGSQAGDGGKMGDETS